MAFRLRWKAAAMSRSGGESNVGHSVEPVGIWHLPGSLTSSLCGWPMTREPVKHRPAVRSQRYPGLVVGPRTPDLNEAGDLGVLPHGISRARAPPCLHRLGIGSRAGGDPGEELAHQEADRLRHDRTL